ncbi:hypothetical protein BC833DRAFT_568512 [Globomyces pollinis-pini]|nr:hypothetical protein BC833DRAFT_568512 [Globomyces pollinis-pini]
MNIQFRKLSTNNELYRHWNAVWDTIALQKPLIHKPSGIHVHLVPVNHQSKASIERVDKTIRLLKPSVVCLEINDLNYGAVLKKANLMPDENVCKIQKAIKIVDSKKSIISDTKLNLHGFKNQDDDLYASEMATALKTALEIGSCVRFIDEDAESLMLKSNSTNTVVQSAMQRFKLFAPNRNYGTSTIGSILYKLACWYTFKGKPIGKLIESDAISVAELNAHLHLWGMFHPQSFHYYVRLRDAVMTERLREILSFLHLNSNQHENRPNTNSKIIVVVIGKSHYFGIRMFFENFIQNDHFKAFGVKGTPLIPKLDSHYCADKVQEKFGSPLNMTQIPFVMDSQLPTVAPDNEYDDLLTTKRSSTDHLKKLTRQRKFTQVD